MASYDERLLASAPVATRAEKQEGYNIDLLDEHKPNGARSASATPPPAPALSPDASRAEAGGYANGTRGGYSSVAAPTKPWYKTRKWLIIFLIGGIVIVGAVVGGAVGGTVGHHSNDSAVASSTDAGAGGGGGEAATNTGSTGAATNTLGVATTTSLGAGTNAPGSGQTDSSTPTATGAPPGQASSTGGPGGVGTAATVVQAAAESEATSPTFFAAGVGSQ